VLDALPGSLAISVSMSSVPSVEPVPRTRSPVITLSVHNHVMPSSDKAAVEALAEALR
jgi:hypothetical protein